nr:SMI1/KNR4 family protein [Nannocystis sp. SCPEA4]
MIAQIEAGAREAGIELPKGASQAAIAELEETLSLTLPDEVKAWFLAHDGGGSQFALENRELLSLERIADEWKIWKDLLDKGVFGENAHSEPGRGVQQKWWIPEWVPLTYDGAGNHDVLDLAPAKGGHYGQILSFWHDDPSRRVVGRSFLKWLAASEWHLD